MDGTLLNGDNQVSDRNKKAIDMAKEKGVHIVLSTGRILTSAINYYEDLKLNTPIIACNGSIVVDERLNTIYQKSIDKESIRDIFKLSEAMNIYYHFYDRDNFYSNVYDESIINYYNKSNKKDFKGINVKIFKDYEEIRDVDIFKFSFWDSDKFKIGEAKKRLNNIPNIEICSSWTNNVEIMKKDVSKGNSLDFLSKKLGIKSSEIIAIGDNENDLSMVKYAGLGVAMGNGIDLLKREADIIGDDNNNDGVAKIIEKYILELGDENK